jgi:ubiquinone/menaquinone biosynthesis C-methylase UbiE
VAGPEEDRRSDNQIGRGYGTFTIPVAREAAKGVHAFDIDHGMVRTTERKMQQVGISNVRLSARDILVEGTGLEAESAGMVSLFNIPRFNGRRIMLEEARRILKPPGGRCHSPEKRRPPPRSESGLATGQTNDSCFDTKP